MRNDKIWLEIEIIDKKSGEWFESDTRFGKLIHAKLGIAEDNSGKLVTKIRNHARLTAKKENADLIIIDGSPGVGCPVIASISGANFVIIVTEPTLSDLHDMERVYLLTKHFKIPATVIINKFDINQEVSGQIESFCSENKIDLLGKIEYSKDFTNAMIDGQTLIEYSDNEISVQLRQIWEKLNEICDSNSRR
jgi:MinD superfamily P-loop ATPase